MRVAIGRSVTSCRINAELPWAGCDLRPPQMRMRSSQAILDSRHKRGAVVDPLNLPLPEVQSVVTESATGLLLMASDLKPIYANAEAIRILAYPEAPEPLVLSDSFLIDKIRSVVLANGNVPHPRVGCTFRLFVDRVGMDVVRACYLDLTGQPVEAEAAQEGRKWLVENQDLMVLPQYLRDGKLTVGEWLRSLRGVRETAWFDRLDLSPFLVVWVGFFGFFWRWLLKRQGPRRTGVVRPSRISAGSRF